MIVTSGCPQQVLGTNVNIARIHATWHVAMEDMSNTALQQTHMKITPLPSRTATAHALGLWPGVQYGDSFKLPL